MRVVLAWALAIAVGVAGASVGSCKKKSSSQSRSERKRTSGPAETVPPEAKAAADKAEAARAARDSWMARVLAVSTCMWIVRDIERAESYFAFSLEHRDTIRPAYPMKPTHYVPECEGHAAALEDELGTRLKRLLELSKELRRLGERVTATINEKDYLEDDFVGLESLRSRWSILVDEVRVVAAAARELIAAERARLAVALEPDLSANDNRAHLFNVILVILETEEVLAASTRGAAEGLGDALTRQIERLAALRETLRSMPVRPREQIFEELSGVLAALKELRRDLARDPDAATMPGRARWGDALPTFYRRSLILFKESRSTLWP